MSFLKQLLNFIVVVIMISVVVSVVILFLSWVEDKFFSESSTDYSYQEEEIKSCDPFGCYTE